MIGKSMRSISHLARESGTSMRSAIINFNGYGTAYCRVLFVSKWQPTRTDMLFVFNNNFSLGRISYSSVIASPVFDSCRNDLSTRYSRVVCIPNPQNVNGEEYRAASSVAQSIILLPESFEKDYNKFFETNSKTITQLIHKFGFCSEDEFIKRIYTFTEDSKNFFVWAINAHYRAGCSVSSIGRILWWENNYKQLVKGLSKSTITAYTTRKDIISLFDEIKTLRREKRINDVVNIFNTAQKKILRSLELTPEDKKVFSSFYRLSESKKLNFVKKMSTIEDPKEIMRQMRHVTSTHFSWNKESFVDYIENVNGINYEKIFENGDVVLVRVKDFETVKNLAKATNWCISKNKTYWNSYVEHIEGAEQFILFDFSQKEDALTSIVGFTCRFNKGITNAHDFSNNNILGNDQVSNISLLNSFISHLKTCSSIYSLLEKHGININLVAKFEKPPYDWNKYSMYEYLFECVDKDNVNKLVDNGNHLVLSIKDKNIRYFLGDTYMDNMPSEYYRMQHIVFMDFGMSQYDPNRIVFAVINDSSEGGEDYCLYVKNEHFVDSPISFENKLSQFGLPYDTIRRIDDKYVRLRDAINSYNTPEIMKGAKDEKLFGEVIYDYVGTDTMAESINETVKQFVSFDYLNIFYENGYTISEFLGTSRVGNLLYGFLSFMHVITRRKKFQIPSQKAIDKFFNKETDSVEEATLICLFLAIDKMIAKESTAPGNNTGLYKRTVGAILSGGYEGSAIDHIVCEIATRIDYMSHNDVIDSIIAYSLSRGGNKVKECLDSIAEKSPYVKEKLSQFTTCSNDKEQKKVNMENYWNETVQEEEAADGDNIDFLGDFDFANDVGEEMVEEEMAEAAR